ncbi:hypothetical protein OROMI_027008 [Orobanche minor]
MLRTYSTGLLAVCLSCGGGGQLVEDVLTSGTSAKLMRYLRVRVMDETNVNQKDGDSKNASNIVLRQVSESSSHLDVDTLEMQSTDRDFLPYGDECGIDEEPPDMVLEVDAYEAEADGEEKNIIREFFESKTKPFGKSPREEDVEKTSQDDSSRRKTNRGSAITRGKVRSSEGVSENEQTLTSPVSGSMSGQARSIKDRSGTRNLDVRRVSDAKKSGVRNDVENILSERDDNDDCFQDCKVGNKDITDLVKKAVRAAEAEARAANAPVLAIWAAGDAAAEVVKTAALEEYSKTSDEEAAVLAASSAASTVIDAGNAVPFSRDSSNVDGDSGNSKATDTEANEDIVEFSIPDSHSLAMLREKFCIQCLVVLGEYVEVLGPVLHEKGVEVCVSLLQRSLKHQETSNSVILLPDILKLICALAAHRKFAALFIDRCGMQRLLSVPRNVQTFFGLSSCLYTIGSIQGIMERVCTLPSTVVNQIVELALQLLECPQDHQARKNAALFFAAAFVFRAVIDAFDAQDGLQKLLSLLNDAASVRSGANNTGSLRNERSPAEALTSSEKQIAYHTCGALRQYFRAHFLLLVDSFRPNKNLRSAPRNVSRAAYKPLDISNEAMDAVFCQIQQDRKLGPALVRACWPVVDKFLASNGHIIMLELCQAPPVERYLHDLLQYALGILHIVTLVPYSRKPILNATLSNDRVGIAVILDAANGAGCVEPEIVEPALNLLINLVCPPPSISNKPSSVMHGQHTASSQSGNGPAMESRDRSISIQNEARDRNGEPASVDRCCPSAVSSSANNASSQASPSTVASVLVGDRRIYLGAGFGGAGLAAQLEQGFHQAREAVRANSGIKVLLHLLQPTMVTSPAALDCLRALTCRVLLGLARDDTIAHILTKLQVERKLSELIRDSWSQSVGGEHNRWRTELAQVTFELIGVVTNSGRASTLAASDAATPTLRRIERAAIAAATPISYHSRELLLLIHEHLQAYGLAASATTLLQEAKLTHGHGQEASAVQIQWPSGRATCGFLSDKSKVSAKKKFLSSSAAKESPLASSSKTNVGSQKSCADTETQIRTPILMPFKRKLTDLKESASAKRLNTGEQSLKSPGFNTPNPYRRSDSNLFWSPVATPKDRVPNFLSSDLESENQLIGQASERLTLDSLVVQYLKNQHRQCPAPITTLPPLSLLQPHMCPEPKRHHYAPSNVTSRLSSREFRRSKHGLLRKDRQFVYSRFRPWRTCRDDNTTLLTCIASLGYSSSRIAVGGHTGDIKVFDSNNNNVLESCTSHQSPVTLLQSYFSGGTQLLLSSSSVDVRLWDASSVSSGPKHSFDGIKAARLSNSGSMFAALPSGSDSPPRRLEILLYDVHSCQLDSTLADTSTNFSSRGHAYSLVHFSPSDSMLLWNGVLWDPRVPGPIHRFDQLSDYGGGGFHPAGNEVIINSEVWDLRKLKLLQRVPSLKQTTIKFNANGDVIYAILRRNLEDVTSAFNARRVKHPLFPAFRTVDAVNYSDIATIPVDRCVLDFTTEPTDSFVGLITMDDQDEMYSSARVYEIGRRKPLDDDSDPDDAEEEDDEGDDDDDDDDSILNGYLDGDSNSGDGDDLGNDDNDDDVDFMMEDFEAGGILEIVSEGDEDNDSDILESFSSGDEDD